MSRFIKRKNPGKFWPVWLPCPACGIEISKGSLCRHFARKHLPRHVHSGVRRCLCCTAVFWVESSGFIDHVGGDDKLEEWYHNALNGVKHG